MFILATRATLSVVPPALLTSNFKSLGSKDIDANITKSPGSKPSIVTVGEVDPDTVTFPSTKVSSFKKPAPTTSLANIVVLLLPRTFAISDPKDILFSN